MIQSTSQMSAQFTPQLALVKQKASSAFGYVFRVLSAIVEDTAAFNQALKISRYVLWVWRAAMGIENTKLPKCDKEWEKCIELIEGVQIFAAIRSLLPDAVPLAQDLEPVHKKIVRIAFVISDIAVGCLWLISREAPFFSLFSKTVKVLYTLEKIADATSVLGFCVRASNTIIDLPSWWKTPKSTDNILKFGENAMGAVSVVLAASGAAAFPLTMSFGAAAAMLGIVRFIRKNERPAKLESVLI